MIGGFFTIISAFFLRETYTTVLLQRKTARLIKETEDINLRSKRDNGLTVRQLFVRAIIRPTKILIMSPIVFACSIYVGVVCGYQYLMFATFTVVFEEQYGFSTKSVGLTFLGIGVGSLLDLFVSGAVSDRILKAKSKPTPESPSRTMQPEITSPTSRRRCFLRSSRSFLVWMVSSIQDALDRTYHRYSLGRYR